MKAERRRVLVVDDRLEMAEMVADGLSDHGYAALAVGGGKEALARLDDSIDAVVTDLRMPEVDGLQVLSHALRERPTRPVIVMTAFGAIETAVESIRRGAAHYLVKPFKLDELVLFLGRAFDDADVRREADSLRAALRARSAPALVGESAPMSAMRGVLARVAAADVPVLITGETGTGKGLVARTLHALGPRVGGPFVTVNCAAIPEALLESELFGHARGAFTGATRDRAGLFAEAHGGALLLDEVAEMSPSLQAKLLDVIERGVVRPVGGGERAVDVRVLAATHRDLTERVASGAFREDLLYRLDVVRVHVPALRDRTEDIPLLLAHFLEAARQRHPGSPVTGFTERARARLVQHGWPGNVRELMHVVERAVILGDRALVEDPDLGRGPPSKAPSAGAFAGEVEDVRALHHRYAVWALGELGGQRGRTAERLGIDAKTLAKWLAEPPDKR